MPAKCIGVCRLQHVTQPSSSAQSFLESDCRQCQPTHEMCWVWALSQHFKDCMVLIYIYEHANGAHALLACHNCLALLACSSGRCIFLSENPFEQTLVPFSLFLLLHSFSQFPKINLYISKLELHVIQNPGIPDAHQESWESADKVPCQRSARVAWYNTISFSGPVSHPQVYL